MILLQTDKLDIAYNERVIVKQLHLTIPEGRITALVGANGSGKSTILKTMARLHKPKCGEVLLDGKSIHKLPTREVAKKLAILPQHPIAPDGLSVEELVSYGRFPYRSGISSMKSDEKEIVVWALEVTGLSDLAERSVQELSGGQRQRAWIAMALAQNTDILFLDEPTTFLDIAHQLEVLKLLRKLNVEQGRTIVMVVHDLNQAARYADHIVAIKNGRIVSQGTPGEVMKKEMLREVFGIEADIIADPRTGLPYCLPYEGTSEKYAKENLAAVR